VTFFEQSIFKYVSTYHTFGGADFIVIVAWDESYVERHSRNARDVRVMNHVTQSLTIEGNTNTTLWANPVGGI
jgi:hypothetical protein